MTQSTSNPSSSNGSDSSNAAQYMLVFGMYMGQIPWPKPAYIPHPGFYYPYGMAPNAPYGAAPPYAPIAPLPGVDAGVAHHEFQAGPHGHSPPAVADISSATYDGPFPPHQGYLHQNHKPGLPTPFAPLFVPRATSLPVGKKRVAEDLEERDVKRSKIASSKINNDPLFKPVLNRHGQPNGTFVCSKDGMVLHPEGYLKHLRTKNHLGYKLEKYECPRSSCTRTYARRDACKRHWDNSCGKLAPEGARQSYADACKNFTSSASPAPVTEPTTAFTYSCPYPMPVTSESEHAPWVSQFYRTLAVADPVICLSQSPENDMVTEPTEDKDDEDDADFWEANEIRDTDEM
ncbi:hypothetical protein BDR03DRAFT_1004903 [Suillus americanus]|nr:hypothetical protein BDR03DRAFT_1004903 [Suillus americanus]